MRRRLVIPLIAALASSLIGVTGVEGHAFAEDSPDALTVLRDLERRRLDAPPFRIRGTLIRANVSHSAPIRFVAECEGEQYRISQLGSTGEVTSVAVFDGEQLISYDGKDSTVITDPEKRATTTLAFDPRTLGLSTGLYSDLTLKKNLAYHAGTDVKLVPIDDATPVTNRVRIELTDEFSQTIHFDIEPRGGYPVHRYSKTIPFQERSGIFTQYVTESEYWDAKDDVWLPRDLWFPRRMVMYTLRRGDPNQRHDDMMVEFERPEFVAGFPPETWTIEGLSLPSGQPVADLRIKRRVGYWDGKQLVESLPKSRPRTTWIVVASLAAVVVVLIAFVWGRKTASPPK